MPCFATVAVGLWLDKEFVYSVPEEFRDSIQKGMRVLVPFGPRTTTGYVLDTADSTSYPGKVKEIIKLLDSRPTFTLSLLEFIKSCSSYYHVPLGELMRKALPPSLHVQSKTTVTLTAKGRTGGDLSDPLLFALHSRSSPLDMRKALRLAPRSRLADLESRGLISIEKSVQEREIAPAMEQWVRLTAYDQSLLTGPRQKEVAAFLREHPHVSMKVLRQHFKNPGRIISILAKKGIVTIEQVRTWREPIQLMSVPPPPALLTHAQEQALAEILRSIASEKFHSFLLHGVTGSGKTEVYLRAVESVLQAGRTALILVPEIALTPQLMSLFSSRFPGKVAILHSALGAAQRYEQWCRIALGELPIVLGARSALFAPLENLGLVIVDEEHEPSFKQDERPFYNARDFALVRGMKSNATVILGSATPSLETFHNAQSKKLRLLRMPIRATPRPLPDVIIVDLRSTGFADSDRIFSIPLASAMAENFASGRQTILFINRRGFANFFLCQKCGHVPRCPNCAVSLTYHKGPGQLRCHYCLHAEKVPVGCPVCGGEGTLMQVGSGTERVMEALAVLFPNARAARLDSSAATGTSRITTILSKFKRGEIDVLVGTQMVAKGHDFPGVTLVGVLHADLSLSFPDFRATERTFQLLTQVAGRAGRGETPGRVFIQTYMPFHYVLAHAQRHDFLGFAKEELDQRKMRRFPPFTALALLKFSSPDLGVVQRAAAEAASVLSTAIAEQRQVEMVGPSMAPIAYLRNRYRMFILLKAPARAVMARFLKTVFDQLCRRLGSSSSLRWDLDVDPQNLM